MASLYNFERKGISLHLKKKHSYPLNLSKPIYDINKSYLENANQGPFFDFEIPKRTINPSLEKFLDFSINSRIGIPAGPLLNSQWIKFAASMGFDVLCYKTIRSSEYQGHSLPNMVYVESKKQLIPSSLPESLKISPSIPTKIDEIAVTNSFGIPSRSPEYLAEDIPKAYSYLSEHQALIISVVGSTKNNDSNELIEDFVTVATQAKEYGAKIIEANFSCPNVSKNYGEIYKDPIFSYNLAQKIVKAIDPVPLIIKMGSFENMEEMEEIIINLARAGVRAISGINTISMKVVDQNGLPALGPNRLTSGICGAPIRHAALEFLSYITKINKKHCLELEILGTGGIVLSNHFDDFLNHGAHIAMTATGMMWDPFIALRYHQKEFYEH